jgi:hypothetical protein
MRPAHLYIPDGVSEIMDQLGMMTIKPPTFVDKMGYFPHRNVDTVFYQLNEGLRAMLPANWYISQGVSEIIDQLGMMMLKSPTFVDDTGYFSWQNIETVFHQLNEGLRLIRGKLGEERYGELMEMSDRMRAHFEADPEEKTDETRKGCKLILDIEELLKQKNPKS